MNKTLEALIDGIPGDDGWWKSSSRDEFMRAATHLVKLGMSDSQAYTFLDDLHSAVRACYGD